MTLTYRSLKLVSRGEELTLSSGQNPALVEESWNDQGDGVQFTILYQDLTWNAVKSFMHRLQLLLSQASRDAESLSGSPVYLYSKTCDSVSTIAEFGPTWKMKRILSGLVKLEKTTNNPNRVAAWLTISVATEIYWRRCQPVNPLEHGTLAAVDHPAAGTLSLAQGSSSHLFYRKIGWTAATGVTVRYLWQYRSPMDSQLSFMRVGGSSFRLYYGPSWYGFAFLDESAQRFSTSSFTMISGQVYDLVLRLGTSHASLFVDGVLAGSYSSALSWPSYSNRHPILSYDAGTGVAQYLRGLQVWPTLLTDAEVASLTSWGRPDAELPLLVTPADGATPTPVENTSSRYSLVAVPGTAPAPLRTLVAGYVTAFRKVIAGIRQGGVPRPSTFSTLVTKYEAESGTLGSGVTSVVDSSASNGNVARYTPTSSAWAARVTVTLAADAANVTVLRGTWRLLVLVKDSASVLQTNSLRYCLNIAGQRITDYSEEVSAPALSTRSLVDLGTLQIPPSQWSRTALASTGTQYVGNYLTLEIQVYNSIGTGGGTLDIDALYLVPVDAELEALTPTWSVSNQVVSLDFVNDPPTSELLFSTWSAAEWAGLVDYLGDSLEVPPNLGVDDNSLLVLQVQRDTLGQTYPKDTSWVYVQIQPRWVL